MTDDYLMYYGWHPYRNAPAQERLSAMFNQSVSYLGTICGYTALLGVELQKHSNVPTSISDLHTELDQAGRQLSAVREAALMTAMKRDPVPDYDELLDSFRAQALPSLETLRITAARFPESNAELELLSPDVPQWMKHIEQAVHAAWIMLDALTNPDLQLPSYLTDWARIRNEVSAKAFKADPSALNHLLQALQNPISDIRLEAALLLRHLRDVRAVPLLIQALNDEDERVRDDAAETLGVIGDPQATESLVDCFRRHPDNLLRGAALALRQLRDPICVKTVGAALEQEMANPRESIDFRMIVIGLRGALKAIGGPEAQAILSRFDLEDDERTIKRFGLDSFEKPSDSAA